MEDIETGKVEEILQLDITNDQQKRIQHAFDKRVLYFQLSLFYMSCHTLIGEHWQRKDGWSTERSWFRQSTGIPYSTLRFL